MFPSSSPDKFTSSNGFDSQGKNTSEESHALVTGCWEDSVDTSSGSSIGHEEDSKEEEDFNHGEGKVHLFSGIGNLDGFGLDTCSPPFQVFQEPDVIHFEDSDTISLQEKIPQEFPLASLGLIKNYQCKLNQLNGVRVDIPSWTTCNKDSAQKLSTNAIIRLAAERFIQCYSLRVDDLLSHPFATSLLGCSAEDTRDVDLVGYVLTAAEKVDQHQFSRASRLLSLCFGMCSNKGNPVQRLVYYFSQALQEKMNKETGITFMGKGKASLDLEEELMSPRAAHFAFHEKVPFSQVSQHTGVQAIVESVVGAKKVHLVDLAIMDGCCCVMLMQALASRSDCPIEHLKVTAVATKLKQNFEETGKRLINFAESINLAFSFHVLVVDDMLDLKKSLFELDSNETVAVQSSYLFSFMIARPDRLDYLMRVIRNLNPCIMVVTETEGNLTSPVFVNRFVEALFLNGALFDCMDDCMDHQDPSRMFIESVYFYEGIQSSVARYGQERSTRHVNLKVWRDFFSRFGMMQVDLSLSSLEQARFVLKRVACWSSCTLDIDEKGLIIGWKGTPVHSLSCWKFV